MYPSKDTEIDWVAYMEQVKQFEEGERDYTNIKGGTGPLVYPAVHLYVYRLLYAVTDRGHDIFAAQVIFAVLYLATLTLVMACYRRAQVRRAQKPILISIEMKDKPPPPPPIERKTSKN